MIWSGVLIDVRAGLDWSGVCIDVFDWTWVRIGVVEVAVGFDWIDFRTDFGVRIG